MSKIRKRMGGKWEISKQEIKELISQYKDAGGNGRIKFMNGMFYVYSKEAKPGAFVYDSATFKLVIKRLLKKGSKDEGSKNNK